MKFEKFENMIQYFANEYCKPKSNVLIIKPKEHILLFESIFKFINTDVTFLDSEWYQGIDITNDLDILPFEDNSFDLVISFGSSNDIFRITKETILIKDEIVNAKENYLLMDSVYSVI